MIANYHTHTHRCHHANGLDEEYIKKAITEGVKILGFSDHAPYIFKNNYVSYFKMLPEEADEYHSSLSRLREKYRDKIEIYIGYEAEYYPEVWEQTLEFWKRGSAPEYLVLGQHMIGEEHDIEGRVPSTRPNLLIREYVDETVAGIKTGVFTYLAHPDLVNYTGDDETYEEEMTRLVQAANEENMPLEINSEAKVEVKPQAEEVVPKTEVKETAKEVTEKVAKPEVKQEVYMSSKKKKAQKKQKTAVRNCGFLRCGFLRIRIGKKG